MKAEAPIFEPPSSFVGPTPRVLLVEPVLHVHAQVHVRAALSSFGFEKAQFTLLTGSSNKVFIDRLRKIEEEHSNLEVRVLDNSAVLGRNRLASLRANHFVLQAAENLLRTGEFDFVAYLMIDNVLPFFAHPLSKVLYPGHFAVGLTGIVFRDNGLRAPANSFKERLKCRIDRWILRRSIEGRGVRKLAFFDHRCTDRARELFDPQVCGYGVDPIEIHSCDATQARQQLGLPEDAHISLMFGAISDRKGIVETLNVLNSASATDLPADRIVFLLAGPVDPTIRDRLQAAIKETEQRYRVIFHDGFVKDEDLHAYFASVDCVLCTYKNFNASSGVLLHAASFGKPALVSEGGVMSDAMRRYGFGDVVEFSKPEDFIQKFKALIDPTPERKAKIQECALNYAKSMDARRYMAQFS